MLVRSLLAWSRLWSKNEMHSAELNDEVESEAQASAVSVREFRCESHRQVLTGTYFFTFISWHLRAIFKLVTGTFSPQQLMLHWWWNIDGLKVRVLIIDNYDNFDVRMQREHFFPPQNAALANRTSLIKDFLSRLNISGYVRLVGCKRIRLLWDNAVCIWYQANYAWHMKPVG